MSATKRLLDEEHFTPMKPMTIIHHTDSLWQSESQSKILPALLKFHKMDIRITKDRTVQVGGGKTRSYTTLDEIISKVKPALADCGLLIHQHLAGPEVVTMLVHESGEFLASKVGFTPMQGNNTNALQNAGGGLTYLKRYAISALLNINADEDQDGEGATVEVKQTVDMEKLAKIKTWIDEGKGTLEQVRAKYQLSALQLDFLTKKPNG